MTRTADLTPSEAKRNAFSDPISRLAIAKTLLLAIVFVLVVMLSALAAWHQAAAPWLSLNDDHENIAIMFYKNRDPALFPRDYFFQDNRYFAYYTPSFLTFINLTAQIGGDYYHAIALLQAPVLALYLPAAYLLFWQVSCSRATAMMFTLLSVLGATVWIDFWQVNSLYSVIPRTTVLPGIMLASFLMVRYLQPWPQDLSSGEPDTPEQGGPRLFNGNIWWHWLALGVLIGISANLHPTTGITFALMTGIVSLAGWWKQRRPNLEHIAALVIGTVIASGPIVLSVSGSGTAVETARTSEAFHTFAAAFEWRVTMLPAPFSRLAAFADDAQYMLAVGWLLVTVLLWTLSRANRRSLAGPLFVGVQLAYVWVLVKNLDEYVDGLMIAVAGGFFVWRWWMRDEQRELLWYEMMAAIVGISFMLPLLLRVVWLQLEIWSLTTIVAELTRGARLLTIPFYIIGARLALHLAKERMRRETLWLVFIAFLSLLVPLSIWHGVLLALLLVANRNRVNPAVFVGVTTAVSTYMIYQLVTRTDANLVAAVTGAYAGLAVYLLSRLRLSRQMISLYSLLGAVVGVIALTAFNVIAPLSFTNDSPWYTFALRGSPDFITFLLGSAAGLGLWVMFRDRLLAPGRTARIEQWGWRMGRFDLFTWLTLCLIAVMGIQTVGMVRFSLRAPDSEQTPALVQAAQWAQANTPQDALFFDTAGDGSEFRLWSLRSITHGSKELGLVGYARPTDMAAMLARYQRIVAATETTSEVLAMADELGVDYIIRDKDEPLDLPVVYENDDLVIYELLP